MHSAVDSYSAFVEADGKTTTGLAALLRARGVRRIFACGLATDFCVAHSALDARREGFEKLFALPHVPGYFIHMGFSIVPHLWVPEKIFTDCVNCPQFRKCGQYAMVVPVDSAFDAERGYGVPASPAPVA